MINRLEPSHLGTLVAASLIGALALAANHFTRLDPQELGRILPTRPVSASRRDDPATDAEPFAVLKQCHLEMARSLRRWRSTRVSVPPEQIQAQLKQMERLNVTIQADANRLPSEREWSALLQLSSRFMAAEMNAEAFADEFFIQAAKIEDEAKPREAAVATALRLFHRLSQSPTPTKGLLPALREFSAKYPASDVGIALYCRIARRLAERDEAGLAEQVLQLGIQTYRDQPDADRLIRELQRLRDLAAST